MFQCCWFAFSSHLIKDVYFIVGEVQGDHTAQGPESALLHLDDVAALQVEVGEVGCEHKCPPRQNLQVVVPQVQFHGYL